MDGTCPLPFLLPQTMILAGCTQSGKTEFVKNLLLNSDKMFDPKPEKVIFCYSAWQDAYTEIEKHWGSDIHFTTVIPTKNDLVQIETTPQQNILLILDDKMTALGRKNPDLVETVTVLCHHKKISTVLIVQNIYFSPVMKDISLNTQTIILFNSPRCARQITTLASQIMVGSSRFLSDAFKKATEQPYGYLVIDLHPKIPSSNYKYRTNIFPGQDPVIYLPS